MNVTIESLGSIALVVFTGLSAGLCFTWTNSIAPGVGSLNDSGYLNAFQQMNRAILNPTFFIVFFGPFFLGLINLYVFKNASSTVFQLLILAMVIYFLGVLMVTIFGNVPLNEMLDKTELTTASNNELKRVRERFEDKWNYLHLIRTVSSITSFLLLIITFLIKD